MNCLCYQSVKGRGNIIHSNSLVVIFNSMKRFAHNHPWVVIFALSFITWGYALTCAFVWDDFAMIVTNPSLHQWSTLIEGWRHDFWMLHENPAISGYWRPMVTMVHLVITKFFGVTPWVFHLLSVVLHALIACFFYTFLHRINLVRWIWIPVVFFLVHPLHAETIGFASALPDLLCAFFGFGAIVLWTSPALEQRKKLILTVVCLLCSMFCKESGIFFGIFLVVVDWVFYRSKKQNRKNVRLHGLIAISIAFYLFVHIQVTQGLGMRQPWGGSLFYNFLTVAKLFGYQLFLIFAPLASSPTRGFQIVTGLSDPYAWLGLAMLIAAVTSLIVLFRRQSAWAFVILFYLIFWFPVSNFFPAEGLIADRYLYLMTMAAGLLLGMFASRADQQLSKFIAVAIFMAFVPGSFLNIRHWKDNETLWGNAVKVTPESAVAWNEWGNVLLLQKKYKEANASFQKAVELRPTYADASLNRVIALMDLQDDQAALNMLEQHLQNFSKDAKAYDLLGAIYEKNSNWDQSISASRTAVELKPMVWKYHYNLAGVYLQKKQFEQAIDELKIADSLTQGKFEVLKNLAASYCYDAKYQDCLDTYQRLVTMFPEFKSEFEQPMQQTRQLLELTQGS
jgi:tetratricopeptide (TPR) repeat protein